MVCHLQSCPLRRPLWLVWSFSYPLRGDPLSEVYYLCSRFAHSYQSCLCWFVLVSIAADLWWYVADWSLGTGLWMRCLRWFASLMRYHPRSHGNLSLNSCPEWLELLPSNLPKLSEDHSSKVCKVCTANPYAYRTQWPIPVCCIESWQSWNELQLQH